MYFREKTAIFFTLFIPVMLMSIFGLLNMGGGIEFKVAVVDQANNQASKQVIETLKKVDSFKITQEDKKTALDQLENSKQSFVVVLPENFSVQVKSASPQNVDIYYDQSQNASNTQVGFTIFDKVFDGLTHQITRTPNYFKVKQIAIGGNDLRYIDYLVPGLVAMSVMQMSIFAVTAVMVAWKERGILKRLLATPIHPSVIIFSQITSRLLTTIMQAGLLILMGLLLFNLHIVGNIGLVVLLIVMGGLIFLSLGFALSGIAKTQNAVAALAQLFVFPQMFLSGIFFPRDSFPQWLQTVSDFFPLTFFSEAIRDVMVKGYTLFQISGDLLGMLVWIVIMFILAVWLFRWE